MIANRWNVGIALWNLAANEIEIQEFWMELYIHNQSDRELVSIIEQIK